MGGLVMMYGMGRCPGRVRWVGWVAWMGWMKWMGDVDEVDEVVGGSG